MFESLDLFEATLKFDYVGVLAYAVVIFTIMEAVGSRILKNDIYAPNDTICNLGMGVIEKLALMVTAIFAVVLYANLLRRFAFFDFSSLTGWHRWVGLCACFTSLDFLRYWRHRLMHTTNIGWAIHQVHHQSQYYNLPVALRGSVLGPAVVWLFLTPLAFVGFPLFWVVAILGACSVHGFFLHSQYVKKLPSWIEFIFNTPSHHRAHHGRNPQYIDTNMGFVLIVWDRLFGTFAEEVEPPVYGIIHPINSFHPFQVQILPFYALAKGLRSSPGFWQKVRYCFSSPGALPASGSASVTPSLKEQDLTVYNPEIGSKWLIICRIFFYPLTLGLLVLTFASRGDIFTPTLGLLTLFLITGICIACSFLDGSHLLQRSRLHKFAGMLIGSLNRGDRSLN